MTHQGSPETPLIEVRGVSKRYGEAQVLDEVSLTLTPGTIHAFVGENGAGKSTLARILGGDIQPDSGAIAVDRIETVLRSPRAALQNGIALVNQEVALVPSLSVLENVMLGAEASTAGVLRDAALRRRFDELLEEVGFDLQATAIVGELSIARQQQVEILRALAKRARVFLFDEPTAALDLQDGERLLTTLTHLREAGRTVVLVSHFLDDVLRLADEVTILKDGRLVRSSLAADETELTLVHGMLGRDLEQLFPSRANVPADAPERLRVELPDGQRLHVRRGEVLGIAGLAGSGRSTILRGVVGAERRAVRRVEVDGEPVRRASIRGAMAAGIAYVPENRRDDALVPMLPVGGNISLPLLRRVSTAGVLDPRRERRIVHRLMTLLAVKPADPGKRIGLLSGGNQQKAILARCLGADPLVLVIDEPTRGVDIGSRQVIYAAIRDAAAQGTAVLFVSSDLDEVRELADRILVVRRGRIVEDVPADTERERLLLSAFGIEEGIAA